MKKNTRKKSDNEFKRDIYELVGEEYTVLSEYKNNRDKVQVRHNKCGHIWEARPDRILAGDRCPKC